MRANRKRLGLSQDEVAFLLGTQSGAKVCRYERFVREPSLETAFAYEAIFRRSVRELFGGVYQEIERKVAARASALAAFQFLPASRTGLVKAIGYLPKSYHQLMALENQISRLFDQVYSVETTIGHPFPEGSRQHPAFLFVYPEIV